MADISKITLPNESTYDIKDATARSGLANKITAPDSPSAGDVLTYDSTNGWIASALPADSDENVKQTKVTPSSYTYWRAIPFGTLNASSATGSFPATDPTVGRLYSADNLRFQPSEGILRVIKMASSETAATGKAGTVDTVRGTFKGHSYTVTPTGSDTSNYMSSDSANNIWFMVNDGSDCVLCLYSNGTTKTVRAGGSAAGTVDLGTSSNNWKDLYLGGTLYNNPASTTVASGDKILVNDTSAGTISSGITLGTSTTKYLAENGSWQNMPVAGTDYIAPPSSPSDGDVLTYDNANSTWIAAAPSGGGLPSQSASTNGYYLRSNGTSGAAWVEPEAATELSIDSTPTEDSDNLVTSGGVWDALQNAGSGSVTSVGVSNATNGGLSVSGSPITSSGTITIGHSNVLTNAQTTEAVYPIKIDKNGHISSYGSAVTIPSVASTSSILKGNGSGGAVAATAGTDYQAPLTAGTDYIAPPSSPSSGDVLSYNGSAWVASTPAGGLPDQTGNSGKYLTTDGSSASWGAATSATKLSIDNTPTSSSSNLVKSGGVYTAINDKVNRTTAVNAADTNYTTLMARGAKLLDSTTFNAVSDWSTHLVNGTIAWCYE